MKIYHKLIFSLFLIAFSNRALAYGYLTNLNGPGVTIKTYFVHNGGGISLILNENVPLNPDGCGITDHVYIKPDVPGYKAMVSAALAAFSSGKSIGLHDNDCEIIPFWGGTKTIPTISNLWIFQ